MKASDIRSQKIEDVVKLLDEKQSELSDLQFAIKFSGDTNIAKRRVLRKEIARIQTVLSEKRIAGEIVEKKAEQSEVPTQAKKSTKESGKPEKAKKEVKEAKPKANTRAGASKTSKSLKK